MAVTHASLTGAELHESKGVATAASGQIYVADGSGSGTWRIITGADLPSAPGTPVLLNTLVASASASLQDTTSITATYRYYKILFENLVPATNNVSFTFQPFISGAFQTATLAGLVANGGGVAQFATGPYLNGAGVSNTAGYGVSGELQLKNPSSTNTYKVMNIDTGYITASFGLEVAKFVLNYVGSQAAVTGFKVIPTSGNIATGTIKIYGWN